MKRKPLLLSVLIAISFACAIALSTGGSLLAGKLETPVITNSFSRWRAADIVSSSTANAQLPDANADEILEQALSALEDYRTPQGVTQERPNRSNEIPTWIAVQLIDAGRINQALDLAAYVTTYGRPRLPEPRTHSERLLLLVDAIALQREPEAALLLLQHMLSERELSGMLEENTYSHYFEQFVSWIGAAIQLEKYELATGLLNKLTTLHEPNLDQQLEIVKLWIKLDQPEQASTIVEFLRRQQLSSEQRGYLCVLLMALGQNQSILAMLERENFTPRQQLSFAIALAELGQLDHALEIANRQPAVLDEQGAYAERPSSGKLEAFAEIAFAFAAVGERDRARDILHEAAGFIDELPSGYSSHGSCHNARSWPYSLIAKGFVKIRDFEQANSYISAIHTCFSMASPFPSSVPGDRASVMRRLLNEVDRVQDVMTLLPKDWRVTTTELDDNAAKAEIAVHLAKLGALREALWVASTIRSASIWDIEEYLWTPLSLAFVEPQAFATTQDVEDEIDTPLPIEHESIESIATQIMVMIRVGYEAQQTGDSEKAERFFQQALGKIEQLPSYDDESSTQSDLTRINIAATFNIIGQRRLAIEVLDSIPPEVAELEATGFPFVKLLTDLMQFNHAVEVATSIPQFDLQAKSLAYIASKLYAYEQ